jgi:energy-coupling factor transport system ATP-binding protein
MDEITRFANRLVVFNDGKIAFDIPMKELFKHSEELVKIGLDIPTPVKIANALKEKGIDVDDDIITSQDLISSIVDIYNKKHGTCIDKNSIQSKDFDFSIDKGDVFNE